MKINEKITKLRKQHNMTQEELARRVFSTKSTVSKWESGIMEPDLQILKSLSKLFNVDIALLIDDEKALPDTESKEVKKSKLDEGLFQNRKHEIVSAEYTKLPKLFPSEKDEAEYNRWNRFIQGEPFTPKQFKKELLIYGVVLIIGVVLFLISLAVSPWKSEQELGYDKWEAKTNIATGFLIPGIMGLIVGIIGEAVVVFRYMTHEKRKQRRIKRDRGADFVMLPNSLCTLSEDKIEIISFKENVSLDLRRKAMGDYWGQTSTRDGDVTKLSFDPDFFQVIKTYKWEDLGELNTNTQKYDELIQNENARIFFKVLGWIFFVYVIVYIMYFFDFIFFSSGDSGSSRTMTLSERLKPTYNINVKDGSQIKIWKTSLKTSMLLEKNNIKINK